MRNIISIKVKKGKYINCNYNTETSVIFIQKEKITLNLLLLAKNKKKYIGRVFTFDFVPIMDNATKKLSQLILIKDSNSLILQNKNVILEFLNENKIDIKNVISSELKKISAIFKGIKGGKLLFTFLSGKN